MAYPSDPRNPADASAAPRRGHLTPEEADRLAAQFRPCWEVDDAYIAAPTTVTVSKILVTAGDGTRQDARGTTAALNGTHLPAPASGLPSSQQPESSVIIDSSDILPSSAGAAPPARLPAAHTLVLPDPVGNAGLQRAGAVAIAGRTVPFAASQHMAAPLETIELTDADFAKPARKMGLGLWAGIGAAAAAVLGIAIWLGSGPEDKHPTPAQVSPSPLAEKTHTVPAAVAAPSPPPGETSASPPSPPAAAPSPPPAPPAPPAAVAAPATVAAAAPAPPPPVAQAAAAAPQAAAPPPPRLFVPAAPRPPTWVPPAARQAAPPPRPKPAGQTIVRDVPF